MNSNAATAPVSDLTVAISQLQSDAWAAWNASYSAPEADAFRAVSLALYEQDVHERINTLFNRLDEQNVRLDALLASKRRKGRKRCSR